MPEAIRVLTGVRKVTSCPHLLKGFVEDVLLNLSPLMDEPLPVGPVHDLDFGGVTVNQDFSLFVYCGEQCPDCTTASTHEQGLYIFGYQRTGDTQEHFILPVETTLA